MIRDIKVCNFTGRKLLILGYALVIGIDEGLKQLRRDFVSP